MKFALVRLEPTDEMIDAAQEEISERHKVGCGVFLSDIWSLTLAASPELSDEEIDRLCRMMWPDSVTWTDDFSPANGSRDKDRTRMRTFLSNLKAPPHG